LEANQGIEAMSAVDATVLARVVADTVGALLDPVAGLSLLASVVTLGVLLVSMLVEHRDLGAPAKLDQRSGLRRGRSGKAVRAIAPLGSLGRSRA
jgi:hypothetical protein